ncbi:MAG: lysophospholipid acyltransferase family protein [Flammeovirgaceae bacterium]
MSKFFKKIYLFWGGLWFFMIYVCLFPFFVIIVQREQWHKYGFVLNKLWAMGFFTSVLMPFGREVRGSINKKKAYVYCPNHASMLDIPTIGMSAKQFIVFVGKNSLSKIPIFGYMFNRLHIPINRNSLRDSYKAFERAKAAILKGRSVLLYPEGGIRTKNPPNMVPFKDGAFRVAIETKTPIIPVTIVNNWKILFSYDFFLTWRPVKVIYHEPIPTDQLTLDDVDELKQQVYDIIYTELATHFPTKMIKASSVSNS